MITLKRFTRVAQIFIACLFGGELFAEPLLQPGDRILAVGRGHSSNSRYPDHEGPSNVFDSNTETKYLNFGGTNSGVIITLQAGSAPVRSIEMATANDVASRDPSSFVLYGSNDTILSTDNSTGLAENWTEIASGPLNLPDDRASWAPAINITNDTAYLSYKLLFPTLKGDTSLMQVSEIEFYDWYGGFLGGGNLLSMAPAAILAVHVFNSGYPSLESPSKLVDGDSASKYLNFAKLETGFIVVPSVGPTRIESFSLTTANDSPERDPSSYELYGTMDDVESKDNETGEHENWTLIVSGSLTLPDTRQAVSDIVTASTVEYYKAYKMIFPTVRDATSANSMQVAEVQFFGQTANHRILDLSLASGNLTLEWESEVGVTYQISYSSDLLDWSQKVPGTIAGSSGSTSYTFTNPMPTAQFLFFRINKL